LRGIEEARAVSPARFDEISEMFLTWLEDARGEQGIAMATDAFVRLSGELNLAQARYEEDGHYANNTFAEAYADHYSDEDTMSGYLWASYLTNFLWAHHIEICCFYQDYFLNKLAPCTNFVEIASGHGGWGAWALRALPKACLQGYDISSASVDIAQELSRAAGLAGRATYSEKNALSMQENPAECADAVISCFVLEHLERPEELFAATRHLLKPRGYAFITGALTAAEVSHIYEYRHESELVRQCEENGLRVLATLSAGPKRTLPNARFLPRSMALVLQKRMNDTF
jgi:ubiquinone/menaquinone biosynthesis C-methylase UbiE